MTNDLTLTIDGIAAGGRGVAFHDHKPVFIPYTIPGEVVTARITAEGERHSEAEGITLIEASADRVFPACKHFGVGRCALCQWQHIDYAAQLLLKQDILADQLSRLGKLSDRDIERALRPVIPAPLLWGYNHHISFSVIPPEGDPPALADHADEDDTEDAYGGQFIARGRLGTPSTDEGRMITLEECPVTHPDVMTLVEQLQLDLTGIKRVRLEIGSDGALMIVLSIITEQDEPELESDFPASVNLLLPDNEPMNLIGDSHSRFLVNGRWFRATAGSFFRANVGGVGILAKTVSDLLAARTTDSVLDLYAGVGVLSAAAAERAALVTLVESYPPTATDADENLADLEHVEVIEGSAANALEDLEDEYNSIIVDPPSAGLGDEIVRLIGERAPARLVYVSSDPASLARDVKRLATVGYRLTTAQPIDLAPQTYYLETVARFDRVVPSGGKTATAAASRSGAKGRRR